MPHGRGSGIWELLLVFAVSSNNVDGPRYNLQKSLKVRRFSGVWRFSAHLEKEVFYVKIPRIVIASPDLYGWVKEVLYKKGEVTTTPIKSTEALCPQLVHIFTPLQLKDGLFQVTNFRIFQYLQYISVYFQYLQYLYHQSD